MPNLFRSRLLALALAVSALACATVGPVPAQAGSDETPSGLRLPIEKRHPLTHVRVRKRTIGERAARIALRAVGVPYRWGGTSPSGGFDCSGLVYWAYGRVGLSVPHSSYALYGLGRQVPRRRLRAGDILFFSGLGHVGIYVGRGRMVHAPHSGTQVEVVSLGGSNYGSRLVGARRLAR